jgi:hypothetical protein
MTFILSLTVSLASYLRLRKLKVVAVLLVPHLLLLPLLLRLRKMLRRRLPRLQRNLQRLLHRLPNILLRVPRQLRRIPRRLLRRRTQPLQRARGRERRGTLIGRRCSFLSERHVHLQDLDGDNSLPLRLRCMDCESMLLVRRSDWSIGWATLPVGYVQDYGSSHV